MRKIERLERRAMRYATKIQKRALFLRDHPENEEAQRGRIFMNLEYDDLRSTVLEIIFLREKVPAKLREEANFYLSEAAARVGFDRPKLVKE